MATKVPWYVSPLNAIYMLTGLDMAIPAESYVNSLLKDDTLAEGYV